MWAEQMNSSAKRSQAKIDNLTDETRQLLSEYKTVLKEVEGLRVYNRQLEKQIDRQEERLKEIDKTMKEAQVMQRQIPPFTRRMLSGIETSLS